MTACCACAKCQCFCHHRLTEMTVRQIIQEVLAGQPLAKVAERYRLKVGDVRAFVDAECSRANPVRYHQHGRDWRPSLYWLRIYATDYGFAAAPKYAAWRREREESMR